MIVHVSIGLQQLAVLLVETLASVVIHANAHRLLSRVVPVVVVMSQAAATGTIEDLLFATVVGNSLLGKDNTEISEALMILESK